VQHQVEMLSKHINFLRLLDTDEFYEKDEDDVVAYARDTIHELVSFGKDATSALVTLLNTEFTWSCFFAITILRQTKDPAAVPPLISFLKKESDDSMANEEAMFALQDIGDPSITPLIDELDEEFDNKKYNSYLAGALTGIIGPAPYDFMIKITTDYIAKPWRYKGWFHIEDFTYNFTLQERTDVLPILRQLLGMKTITGTERQEIEDTIKTIENPEQYNKDIQETVNELSEETKKFDT
jgi:HEAT repeat protein